MQEETRNESRALGWPCMTMQKWVIGAYVVAESMGWGLVMLGPIQLSKMPTSKGAQGERWYLLTRPHFCFPIR